VEWAAGVDPLRATPISPRPAVVAINEPIAPIESLWRVPPEAELKKASQHHHIALDDSFYPFLIFSVGGYAVTRAAKERIVAACVEIEKNTAVPFEKTAAFVIWVSLRLTFRHAVTLMTTSNLR
jgi:hypothetical protein